MINPLDKPSWTNFFCAMLITTCTACSANGQSVSQKDEQNAQTEQAEQAEQVNNMQSLAHNKMNLLAGITQTPISEENPTKKASTTIIFYVENQTNADQQLLIWNTPFEQELSADVFTVLRNKQAVTYLGLKMKRGTPGPADFMSIKAGERLLAEIDIADYYDLSKSGQYTVSFTPSFINGIAHLNQLTPVELSANSLVIAVQ